MKFSLIKLRQFSEWYESLSDLEQNIIDARLLRIQVEGHFGNTRHLEKGLFEIKFSNGFRIYCARTGITELILLLGGDKNGQEKDIKKAKKLLIR